MPPSPPARPNVLFIVSDDQGAGDYGFMGHQQVQTPHLDKLASESLTFSRGFVPTSVCCPSLATIISGLYPHQHRVTANDPPLPPGTKGKGGRGSTAVLTEQWNGMLDNVTTLPRILSGAGYLSFQTGKWWQGDFSRGGFTHGMSKGSRHGDAGLTIGREGMEPIYDFIADSCRQQKPFFVWYGAVHASHAAHATGTIVSKVFHQDQLAASSTLLGYVRMVRRDMWANCLVISSARSSPKTPSSFT